MDGVVTIVDVARRAGVSRQTVSNVLNAPQRVAATTRSRVGRAIDDLGYRPHRGAQHLRRQATGLIGYRVPSSRGGRLNPVLDRFLHDLCDSARDGGRNLLLFTPAPGQDELAAYEELVSTRAVDGFVLSETVRDDPRVAHLAALGAPMVAFGRTAVSLPHARVDVDGAAGVAAAVRRLAAAGHRRVAFAGWPHGSMVGDDRARGWSTAVERLGLDDDPGLDRRMIDDPDRAADATLAWVRGPRPPSAVVAVSNELAIGVVRGARRGGVPVGRDGGLALIAFDDSPVAPLITPPLTTLRQPLEVVGRELIRLLDARIEGDDSDVELLLEPMLVPRASG